MITANQNEKVEGLLNNESFVRWMQCKGNSYETDLWNRWMSANPENRELVLKAGKLMNIPFDVIRTPFLEEELFRLKQSLHEGI